MTSLRAFVIEDSPVIRENLIAALEELTPFRCVGVAEDEASAVGWLQVHASECDVVIVDLFLRAGSGLGVLRAAAPTPDKRPGFVALSNYATPDMRRKCSQLGATRVFDKSREIDELIAYCSSLGS